MNGYLGDLIEDKDRNTFKSKGECRIARFLAESLIEYQYESCVMVKADDGKPRLWYPDFYLLEFGIYIEYYGLAGEPEYDKGIKAKESVYAKNSLDVIAVYPWMFSENWKGYILTEIEKSLVGRHRVFKSKLYRFRKGSTAKRGNRFI